ncbi:MAG: hypothetical protein JXB07_19750 [Anaerolineae bacterium]|nr:hypothetical protein [Anaerolineae bacterium]
MAKLTFFPIGNADSTLIHLNDGRLILQDFCNRPITEDHDTRVQLDEELRGYLAKQNRQDFDAVAFTHADSDHVDGAEDFFWFDHAAKYQDDDRILISELWVPACFILEAGLKSSARAIRQEARFRFTQGSGIRIFGNPDSLSTWLQDRGIDPASRSHLITHAGTCVPGFSRSLGQVEIFIHSPFSFQMEGETVDRNGNSLVAQWTFVEDGYEMRCIMGADAEYQAWTDIVYITNREQNCRRLDWDLFHISHHCSYTALALQKGEDETTPILEVQQLFSQGNENSLLISPSLPIPNEDTDQPPHRQAAAFYRQVAEEYGDVKNFVVTMEEPTPDNPKPIVVETSRNGFVRQRRLQGGAASVTSRPSPRLG